MPGAAVRGEMESPHGSVDGILMRIPFRRFGLITVALPGVSLFVCFVSAVIFQFEDVNDTSCNVTNLVPSISAVTGIQPQTYIWRTCIALHSTPRFAVALIHYNYYKSRLSVISKKHHGLFRFALRLNFLLNFVEDACLTLVAYISNRENYPVHEKIFIVFMVTSLCYMLSNTIIFKWTRDAKMTPMEQRSYWWKKAMFVSIMLATGILLFFFYKHRVLCEPYAFSGFSLAEYVIAYTNMGYHITATLDFKDSYFLHAGKLRESASNGVVTTTLNHKKVK